MAKVKQVHDVFFLYNHLFTISRKSQVNNNAKKSCTYVKNVKHW